MIPAETPLSSNCDVGATVSNTKPIDAAVPTLPVGSVSRT